MADSADSTAMPEAQADRINNALVTLGLFEIGGWKPLLGLWNHADDRPALPAAHAMLTIITDRVRQDAENDHSTPPKILASALDGVGLLMALEAAAAHAYEWTSK